MTKVKIQELAKIARHTLRNPHLFVLGIVKTPFLYIGGVNVISETLDSFAFNLFGFLQYSCELNYSIESPSPSCTFTGHSSERGQWTVALPQCAERECFVQFVEVHHK